VTPTATSIRLIPVAGIKVTPAIGGAAAPVAIIANLTGISGTAGTFLELYPAGPNRPQSASDLNAAAHDVIANLDVVALATSTTGVNIDGNIDLFNSVGSINIVIDVAGWFQ
jgi:choline-glycine betaine transporter